MMDLNIKKFLDEFIPEKEFECYNQLVGQKE